MKETTTTTAIAVINGQQIQICNDEEMFVPIKPICEALGIARQAQQDKIKDHPILSSVSTLRVLTGADGKQYDMVCLPLQYVFGWLFTINPNNVAEDVRPALMRYQLQCYDALFDHFTQGMKRERELLETENGLLKERDKITRSIDYVKEEAARLRKQLSDVDNKIASVREARLNPQPSLF